VSGFDDEHEFHLNLPSSGEPRTTIAAELSR